jgi:hypothetical protein
MSTSRDLTGTDLPFSLAAWLVAAATLLSGPFAFLLSLAEGQPPWRDAPTFAAHAHWVQQVPFWIGFVLIAGCVFFVARFASLAFENHRTRAFLAIIVIAVYAAIITINYALQVAYLPALVRHGDDALAYITLTNPNAPTWVLEMFGYAVLGLATAILAPAIPGASPRRRAIRILLRANGAVSILGALVTAVDLGWVQTPAGLVSFVGWNILLVVAMTLTGFEFVPPRPISESRGTLHM